MSLNFSVTDVLDSYTLEAKRMEVGVSLGTPGRQKSQVGIG